jgi:hypothetical protein
MYNSSKALLIGIDYFDSSDNYLPGCINDIHNVKKMLIDNYFYLPENIILLSDASDALPGTYPSHNTIITHLKNIVQTSSTCNEIWIHYSGHGSQIYDMTDISAVDMSNNVFDMSNNIMKLLKDVIIPADYKTSNLITSTEIYTIIKNSKCNTLLFFDCCNSATICNLPWSFNYDISLNTYLVKQNNSNITKNSNIYSFSGCKDNQISEDVYDISKNQYNGIMTQTVIDCLKTNNYHCSIAKLYSDVCKMIYKNGYSQHPILSSATNALTYNFINTTIIKQKTITLADAKQIIAAKNQAIKNQANFNPVATNNLNINVRGNMRNSKMNLLL